MLWREAVVGLAARLRGKGIATAMLDARLLAGRAAGWSDTTAAVLGMADQASAAALLRFEALARRRLAGEPVSRIDGAREFYGRMFALNAGTLDPRPDSETLVAMALALAPSPSAVIDFGTGSGCLLVSVLAERPSAQGVGVDIRQDALAMARANALRHGLARRVGFARMWWGDGLASARFDLALANPPYIPRADLARLAPEVREHDPPEALDGGDDGLVATRAVLASAARVLRPGGLLVLEVGASTASAASALAGAAGFAEAERAQDLAGHERTLGLRLVALPA